MADSGSYHLWALKLIHGGLVRKGYWYNLEISSCEKRIDYKRENGKFEMKRTGRHPHSWVIKVDL